MEDPVAEPRRFKRYRYGPLHFRLIAPCIAVVVGIVLAVKFAGGIGLAGANNSTAAFVCGLALIPFGIVFFFVALWMGKRGL